MKSRSLVFAAAAATLMAAALPARAGLMDFLFGSKAAETSAAPVDPNRRQWRIADFTAIRIVEREAGAAANQHPARLEPEWLRQQLAVVRVTARGANQPLFGADELAELIEPLAQAFSVAGPGDDLLLLSTSRRNEGLLIQPSGITARLFVQAGALHLIVNDARRDFVSEYRATQIEPRFTFGSRQAAGTAALQSSAATSRRGDWLVVPLSASVAAPAAPAAPAMAPAAAAAAVAAPAAAPAAPAAPVAPAAAPRNRDAAFAEEIEQRLVTLKRLRDRGLITEQEYEQKRREILQLL
jgi:hypothetical protein